MLRTRKPPPSETIELTNAHSHLYFSPPPTVRSPASSDDCHRRQNTSRSSLAKKQHLHTTKTTAIKYAIHVLEVRTFLFTFLFLVEITIITRPQTDDLATCRFGFNASTIDSLLDKEDISLEAILDEDELLQECKAQNTRLINYFSRVDVLKRLLGYVTGQIEGEGKGGFK